MASLERRKRTRPTGADSKYGIPFRRRWGANWPTSPSPQSGSAPTMYLCAGGRMVRLAQRPSCRYPVAPFRVGGGSKSSRRFWNLLNLATLHRPPELFGFQTNSCAERYLRILDFPDIYDTSILPWLFGFQMWETWQVSQLTASLSVLQIQRQYPASRKAPPTITTTTTKHTQTPPPHPTPTRPDFPGVKLLASLRNMPRRCFAGAYSTSGQAWR